MTIECVPNVSEGRRAEVVAALSRVVAATRGVRLLDASADTAHNRSVYTCVGDPEGLETAVLELGAAAVSAIDLRSHVGVHPRIGVLDVVPFVPLEGVTMETCVALARRVGASLGERLGIPVFLYEAAATSDARRRLEDIRRGGLAGLTARMLGPAWAPDFGPRVPHPSAGACAVGARPILIAFNVDLATTDLAIAKRIAARVRESGGGLPAVKAMGVALADRGLVQVSMNLTDFARTSMAEAFGVVEREAARYGVRVEESELVGLVPRAAMAGTSAAALRLRAFSDDRIIENRL